MSKNGVFLSASAVGCKSAKMESNRRLANYLCGLWTPSTVPAGERFNQNFSHVQKHLQHQRIKSLFCTWLWRACTCPCTCTAFERSTREETSPLKPPSLCEANALKRRWTSMLLTHFHTTHAKVPFDSHANIHWHAYMCLTSHTDTHEADTMQRKRRRPVYKHKHQHKCP